MDGRQMSAHPPTDNSTMKTDTSSTTWNIIKKSTKPQAHCFQLDKYLWRSSAIVICMLCVRVHVGVCQSLCAYV